MSQLLNCLLIFVLWRCRGTFNSTMRLSFLPLEWVHFSKPFLNVYMHILILWMLFPPSSNSSALLFSQSYMSRSSLRITMLAKILNLISFAAITTVVTISEILKNNGLATEKSKKLFKMIPANNFLKLLMEIANRINSLTPWYWTEVSTSTVGVKDENKGRLVQKAKVGLT